METENAINDILVSLDKETASKLRKLIEKKAFIVRLSSTISMTIGFILGTFFCSYLFR